MITETKVVEVEKIVTVENKEAIEREKQLLRYAEKRREKKNERVGCRGRESFCVI